MFDNKQNNTDRALLSAGYGTAGALLGGGLGGFVGMLSATPGIHAAIQKLGMTEAEALGAIAYLERRSQEKFNTPNNVLLLDEKDVRSNTGAWKLLKIMKSSLPEANRRSQIGSAVGAVLGGVGMGVGSYIKMSVYRAGGIF